MQPLERRLARTDRDDCLSRGTSSFGASVGFRIGSYRAGSSRCRNASKFLLTHKRVEFVYVRLGIRKADSVPRQHEVSQNVIGIPCGRIGVLKQNGDYCAGVVKIDNPRRQRGEVWILYDQRQGIVDSRAGEAAASRHVNLDKDIKEAGTRKVIGRRAIRT